MILLSRRKTSPKTYDKHHCLWPRTSWNKGFAKEIRNHWYFVVEIPMKTLHSDIHDELPGIPVPPGNIARWAYEQIIMLDSYKVLHSNDRIEDRLEMLASIFDCASQPTADALRQQAKIIHRFYTRPR